MNRIVLILLATSLAGLLGGSAHAETETRGLECLKSARFLAPIDSPDYRKYAPDRDVQPLHLALDVTPDFKQRTIAGQATLRFQPLIKPVSEVKLDAVDLNVASVTSTEKIQGYQVANDMLTITFATPVPPDKQVSVTITYSAEPKEGIYFRTPEMGYKPGDTHLFSQGEEIEARHWYPCFDSPNEKFTSEVTCRVPGRHDGDFEWPAGLAREGPGHRAWRLSLVAGTASRQLPDYPGGGLFQEAGGQAQRRAPGISTRRRPKSNEAANSFRDTQRHHGLF